jgi:2-amino-4-hydroxy-6-hydroxymethyldihydropteridine diphosphokinase
MAIATGTSWIPAYIGVGSNLADPLSQVVGGIDSLVNLPKTLVIARSKMYRTHPMGPQDQPEYVNAAVGVLTQLSPAELLSELKTLESKLGRGEPIVRWGPRVIDFDLLVFGSVKLSTDTLVIPHPGIAARNFVLLPLFDIAPDLDIPGVGRASSLVRAIDKSGVHVL